nr:hypothetical protein CFP56_63007 [Quercus suber]
MRSAPRQVTIWEAPTRLQRSRTGVGLGRTRRRGRDAANASPCRVGPRPATWQRRLAPTRREPGRLGPYRPIPKFPIPAEI